jgi:hypothetical protein
MDVAEAGAERADAVDMVLRRINLNLVLTKPHIQKF